MTHFRSNPRKVGKARARSIDGFLPKELLPAVAFLLVLSLVLLLMERKKIDKSKKKASASKSKGKKATKKSKELTAKKGKGKKKGPAESEVESSAGSESEEEEPLVPPKPKVPGVRGQTKGIYGKTVTHIRRIDLSVERIKDKVTKHTLSAIVKAKWPIGYYSYGEITRGQPLWQDKIIQEFYTYYKHKKGDSRSQGREAIIFNIKSIVKHTMNDEKRRAKDRAKETEKDIADCNPGHWGNAFWAWLVSYWNDEKHIGLSEAAKANRTKQKHIHNSGAMCFEEQSDAWARYHGGVRPNRLRLWEHTHTNKKTGRMTPEATEIAERYGEILEKMSHDRRDEERSNGGWRQRFQMTNYHLKIDFYSILKLGHLN